MGRASGFEYTVRANGDVVITHRRSATTVLRGESARRFLDELDSDPQTVMARWTGKEKRGNERTAKDHPRNAHR